VAGNDVSGNARFGIIVGEASTVTGNTATTSRRPGDSGIGVGQGSTVIGNTATTMKGWNFRDALLT